MPQRATILAVDDDPQVSRAIVRDLRERYGSDYRVVRATSGDEALGVLAELALRSRPVALLVSDQRMPGMTGIELMARVRETSPDTRLLLLTAYADTDVAIKAINDIGLDYYMFKPWEPPEAQLYPVVDDLLEAWRGDHPDSSAVVRVVGHLWSDRSYDVKMFLARNHIPYAWVDLERDEEAARLLDLAGGDHADLPLVLLPEGDPLRSPTSVELADALGLRTRAQQPLYDLCIVGSGPAGLAAAVYAASEGLRTVMVERDAPGGQAGQSAAIENYLGFPKGVSGADLTHRAVAQASRFGAETVLAREVVGLEQRGPGARRALRRRRRGREPGGARRHRRVLPPARGRGVDELGSRGVYYGASASEATQCADQVVHVVGAANSAGQAVLNFAKVASRVVLLVRGARLEDSMSEYLVARITARRQRRRALPHRGGRGARHRPPGVGHPRRPRHRRRDRRGHQLAVRLHRRAAPHRLARRRRRARREGLRRDRPRPAAARARRPVAAPPGAVRPGDEHPGGVRRRRRAPGLDEAGRLRRR